MNLKDMVLQLAVVTAVADRAAEVRDSLRSELQNELEALGADRARAELHGERVAQSFIAGGKAKVQVTDEQAFTAWVAARFPDELQRVTTTTVRSSFREALLSQLVGDEDQLVHPKTGEVVDGVQLRTGRTYVSTRFEPGGRDRIAQALADHEVQLDLTTTPELEGPTA